MIEKKIYNIDRIDDAEFYNQIDVFDNKAFNINYIAKANVINFNNFNEYVFLTKEINNLKQDLKSIKDIQRRKKQEEVLIEKYKRKEYFKKEVIHLYEIFNMIELNTERLRLAKECFDKGEIKQADAILISEQLENDQTKLLELNKQKKDELEKLNSDLRNNAIEFYIKAQTSVLNDETSDKFLLVCSFFENSLKSYFLPQVSLSYASFLREYKHLKESAIYFSKTLEHINFFDGEELAFAFMELGLFCKEFKELDLAEELFEKAINQYANSDKNAKKMFECKDYLASIYFSKKNYIYAEKTYLEVLDYWSSEVNGKPEFEINFAITLQNIALIHVVLDKYDVAEKELVKCLDVFSRYIKNDVKQYDSYSPPVLLLLGKIALTRKDFKRAGEYFIKSLSLITDLICNNSDLYLGNYAFYLYLIANYLLDLSLLSESEFAIKYALNIFVSLNFEAGGIYIHMIADSIYTLGKVFFKREDYNCAEKCMKDSIEIYNDSNNKEKYEEELENINKDLCLVYIKENKFDLAEPILTNLIKKRETYCKLYNLSYDFTLSALYENIAIMYFSNTNYQLAEYNFRKAYAIRYKLHSSDPLQYEENFAATCNNLASLLYAKNEYMTGNQIFNDLIKSCRFLSQNSPFVFRNDILKYIDNIIDFYIENNIADLEESIFNDLIKIIELLTKFDLNTSKQKLQLHYNFGLFYQANNKLNDAQKEYIAAICFFEKLNTEEFPFIIYAFHSHINLANVYQFQGNLANAENETLKSMSFYDALKINSQNYETDKAFALIYNNYGALLMSKNNYKDAEAYFLKSIEMNSNDPEAYANYAHFLIIAKHDFLNAKIQIDKAFYLNPDRISLLSELWFYRYAHYEEYLTEGERELIVLLNNGAKSIGWDLESHIKLAEKHPNLKQLKYFAKYITCEN
jgi:tetratricopeptide (TPR) repeat protein